MLLALDSFEAVSLLEKIRAVRGLKHYSQDYMAQELEVDKSTYSKVERGEVELTITRAEEIAKIFGMNLGELYSFHVNATGEDGEEYLSESGKLRKELQYWKDQYATLSVEYFTFMNRTHPTKKPGKKKEK